MCKAFDCAFAQRPDFYPVLILRTWLDGDSLPQMLHWLQLHSSNVETIVSACTHSWLMTALTAVHQNQQSAMSTRLSTVSLSRINADVTYMLAQFRTITTVSLQRQDPRGFCHTNHPSAFSLKPLQALPSLIRLVLAHGSFCDLEVMLHLTQLSLESCRVKCRSNCACAASLSELILVKSELTNFHTNGVTACCSLEKLTCDNAWISAAAHNEDLQTLRMQQPKVPNSLPALTRLTHLTIVYQKTVSNMQLGWLSALPALQQAWITVSTSEVKFPESISTMSNLQSLTLMNEQFGGRTLLWFDWGGLLALTSFELCGPSFSSQCSATGFASFRRAQACGRFRIWMGPAAMAMLQNTCG